MSSGKISVSLLAYIVLAEKLVGFKSILESNVFSFLRESQKAKLLLMLKLAKIIVFTNKLAGIVNDNRAPSKSDVERNLHKLKLVNKCSS